MLIYFDLDKPFYLKPLHLFKCAVTWRENFKSSFLKEFNVFLSSFELVSYFLDIINIEFKRFTEF